MKFSDIVGNLGLKYGKEHATMLVSIPHVDRQHLSVLLGDPDSIALKSREAFDDDNGHGHHKAVIAVVKGMKLGQIQKIVNPLRLSIFGRERAFKWLPFPSHSQGLWRGLTDAVHPGKKDANDDNP